MQTNIFWLGPRLKTSSVCSSTSTYSRNVCVFFYLGRDVTIPQLPPNPPPHPFPSPKKEKKNALLLCHYPGPPKSFNIIHILGKRSTCPSPALRSPSLALRLPPAAVCARGPPTILSLGLRSCHGSRNVKHDVTRRPDVSWDNPKEDQLVDLRQMTARWRGVGDGERERG